MAVRVALLGCPLGHRADVGALGDGLVVDLPAHDRAGFVAVAHERQRGGGEVVVDGAQRLAEQAVHEQALALLELADDADDRRRARGFGERCRRPGGQVGAIEPVQHREARAALQPLCRCLRRRESVVAVDKAVRPPR